MPGNFFNINCKDPYLGLEAVVEFLTSTVGWSVVETVTDTGSILDVTLSSAGESDVNNSFTRYIRLRNTTTRVFLYAYETYISSVSFTGEVYDSTYGAVVVPTDLQGYQVVVVADLERVILTHINYNNASSYMGYVGRISPYHNSVSHNYPNIVKGSTSPTYTWYYTAAERNAFMLGPTGVQQHYYATEPLNSAGLDVSVYADRGGATVLSAPVLVNNDPDAQKSELVGEPRGVFRASSDFSSMLSFVEIETETYVTLIQGGTSMVLGPIGTVLPDLIDV